MNTIKNLWRWHPKVALRYLPIIKKIKHLGLVDNSILEIGSGSLGIAPYIGKPIIGIDVDFAGPQIDILTKIRGSATKIPFKNKSFNIVLMVDVLEHLPTKERKKAIEEAVRVSNRLLVIATPEGKLSEQEDHYLSKYYKRVYGKEFPFYIEHLGYGLPRREWINDTINSVAVKRKRNISIEIEGNINLTLHRFLMKGWMTKNFFVDLIFRKFFLTLIPIMGFLNNEPTYRKIFYINFKS